MPTDLPLSVWPTAQQTARTQRAGRYVEISGHHPAKMLPAIAQRAIATYTRPGDLVGDPMCRSGSAPGEAVRGDAGRRPGAAAPAVRGLVPLVLPSPPYGPSLHGRVTARPGHGIAKSHHRYSTDPANLAHVGLDGLLDAMRTILTGCAQLLRPGGYLAMTVRPWWHAGHLIDLPGAMVKVGEEAGLILYERNVALLDRL